MNASALIDNRYRIVGEVAEGGMSVVYEVEDVRLSGRMALKVMRDLVADEAVQQQLADQFQHEAELLASLSHPNLPRVTDYFVWEGRRCLVQELVPGQTLEACCDGSLPRREAEVLGWAGQICDALEYLHEHHIIYRDLKPSNCIVTPGGALKLIDFGIARVFSLGKARDTVLMGTPGFAAPEQYGKDQSDPRADIFALGVLMHYLLTGRDPAETPFVFQALRDVNSAVSEGTHRAVMKALSLEPSRRFQTVSDMREALLTGELPTQGVEYFAYPEAVAPPGMRYASAALSVVGIGVLGLVGLLQGGHAAWLDAFAGAYAPLWAGLIVREGARRRAMSRTWFALEEDGLYRHEAGNPSTMPWQDIERVVYRRDPLSGAGMVYIHDRARTWWFVCEAAPAFGMLALHSSDRLCRLLERRAINARVERPRF